MLDRECSAADCPSPETVLRLIEKWAELAPESPAILAPGRPPLSYGQLRLHIGRTIHTLHQLGIGRKDRVAVVLPNGPEAAACFLAVTSCATVAPLNPAFIESELDFYLSDLNAGALIVVEGDTGPAAAAARKLGIPVIRLCSEHDAPAGVFALEGRWKHTADASNPASDDVALILHTSGTTARPKRVPLTHRNLCASADGVKRALNLTSGDRCLNVMPLFHIHGLVAAMLGTFAAGGSIACTPGFYAPQFFGWMREFDPTWFTAVPTMHQGILARVDGNRDSIAQSSLRLIRSCSSPLPPQVMSELEHVFAVPVVEAYGMTEAAHQIASNPLPPERRKAGSVGKPAGPEVAIVDDTWNQLGPEETGEIVIRGVNVTPGYDGSAEANGQAFANGWFRTGDQGFLDNEGYLFINGRIKEIINRGGEKVSPREIDEVLLDHPGVLQAQAFSVPDSQLGEEVAAAVVLADGYEVSERQLREFAATRLAPFKVPRQIHFVPEIPKGPTGKIQRIGLAERLGVAAPGQPRNHEKPSTLRADQAKASSRPAADAVKSLLDRHPEVNTNLSPEECVSTTVAIASIWCEVLNTEKVDPEADFLDLGGDSMLATMLCARVFERFGVELPLIDFFEASSINSQAVLIERLLAR